MKHCVLYSFLCFLTSICGFAQVDTVQQVVESRENEIHQQEKPYVILISADGFRHDYATKHDAQHLIKYGNEGVRASSLIPSFPSKTFPNHYSLVTGLHPAHHGIINNRFYDPQRGEFYSPGNRGAVEDGTWYGGIPLWVLAEQHQMLTASFHWVGSEAAVQGIFPTYYYKYNEEISIDKRINTVVEWLKLPLSRRPHLITFYLPEVDHAGHRYGPDAPETREAVQFVDEALHNLKEAVDNLGLPVNYVFVSDHGMTAVDTINTFDLPEGLDTEKFIINKGDVIVELHAKDKKDIVDTYQMLKSQASGYEVYLKTEMPEHLSYNADSDSSQRIGDVLLVAEWPKIFHLSAGKSITPGRHGYDPFKVKDMQAIFYAWGPNIKRNVQLSSIQVVDVYTIITSILGLDYSHAIDGDKTVARQILNKE